MSNEKHFGKLGSEFQQTLLKSIIENRKYGEAIIEVLDTMYFDNTSFRFIMENIKEYHEIYGELPRYETLSQKLSKESGSDTIRTVHLDTLKGIKELDVNTEYVEDTALNFCKQQNLISTLKDVNKVVENGEFENYHTIEEMVTDALQVGIVDKDTMDIFDDIDLALEEDLRDPIPTGIDGIDKLLKGGIGAGELALVLAPTGVGKTTILTKIGNTAHEYGKNVLQIFFEDDPNNIKRKHFTLWSGLSPDEQIESDENREITKERVKECRDNSPGGIRLIKLPSDSVNVNTIKARVRKLIAEGFKIDLLIIDYIDCISSNSNVAGEEWKGEGSVIRALEAMCYEFQIAIWTATQGNRDSIASEVVTADQMGGSVKKAQSAHVIMSVGKTLEQKENNLATLALIKSRIGPDGVVFNNCKFNNEYLDISTETSETLLGHQENEYQKKLERGAERYRQIQAKKKGLDI